MLLEENFDADEILREPGDNLFEEENEDEVSELNFGGIRSLDEMDIPPEEERDLYS